MTYLLNSFWFKHLPLKKEPYHYLRFEKESHYYELRLDKDLLEDWTLITSNGRIKSKLGQSRTQAFSTYNEAFIQFYSAIDQRYKRKYQITRHLIEDLIYTFLLLHQTALLATRTNDETKRKKTTIKMAHTKQVSLKFNNSQQSCFLF